MYHFFLFCFVLFLFHLISFISKYNSYNSYSNYVNVNIMSLLKVQFTSNEGMSNDAPIHECESEINHYTGHYVPYSLRRVSGFFNVPQIFYYMCKGSWDGAYGLSSLSEKTRNSNRLQMLFQRQYFLLSYLKTLSVGPARVWTYSLPLSRLALIPTAQIIT